MTTAADSVEWNWQWTLTFAVVIGYGIAAMLWLRNLQFLAVVVGILATVSGMAVIVTGAE